MTDRIGAVADVLLEIERQLRIHSLWSDVPPTAAQLQSTQPFAVDTLSFEQWLQFIFLPQMKVIIEQGGALPLKSQIAPMAEQSFEGKGPELNLIIESLNAFDHLINDA